MTSVFILLFSILFFIALPLNIHTTVSPPYGDFAIIGDGIFVLLWLLPALYILFKSFSNKTIIILILILINIIASIGFYFFTETIGLDMRKEFQKKEIEELQIKIHSYKE